jgi:general secretion pathway protein L
MEAGRPVMRESNTIAIDGDAEGRTAMTSLAKGTTPRVVVSVPAHELLRKRIVLPAAVEENLAQVLTYDLDRHTPFKADELYFDATVVERNAARNTVTVDLAAARRTAIDPALKSRAAKVADSTAHIMPPSGEHGGIRG